ncbi:MAG: serine hydrolase domain-containing protein [Pseudomonadota bacterium]
MTKKPHQAPPDLPLGRPEACGLSSKRLERLGIVLRDDVAAGHLPGAVVGIMRAGKLVYLKTFGRCDPSGNEDMASDTLFSIASMTKPLVSVAALSLIEEGRLLLSEPVAKYLPALNDLQVLRTGANAVSDAVPVSRPPLVYDLLRHTAGFSYRDRGATPSHAVMPGSSLNIPSEFEADEFLDALRRVPLVYQPGTTWEYGFSTDVLGLLLEAAAGQRLSTIIAERICRPLGMASTRFTLEGDDPERYARAFPTCPVSGAPTKVMHAATSDFKWDCGGAGALSTVTDYLRFTQMLLNGGELGDVRVLGPKTVDLMTSDHLSPGIDNRLETMDPAASGYGFGLGVAVRTADGLSALAGSEGDFYWSGVYGTYFWCDPAEELACVFMAMTPGDISLRLRYRHLTRMLVNQAIID